MANFMANTFSSGSKHQVVSTLYSQFIADTKTV
jgi:hypothetical protein